MPTDVKEWPEVKGMLPHMGNGVYFKKNPYGNGFNVWHPDGHHCFFQPLHLKTYRTGWIKRGTGVKEASVACTTGSHKAADALLAVPVDVESDAWDE